MLLRRGPNRISHRADVLLTKPNDLVIESVLRIAVELLELLARRLDALATVVDVAQVFQFIFAGLGGSASAGIVA